MEANEKQRAMMRGCLYSACTTSPKLTPLYLCKGRKPCILYKEAYCGKYEAFPERFNT
jgi:hypothetical protein